jgi:hypothetical protein
MDCQMFCDRPAVFYVTAKTTVPMTERQPLCAQHSVTYGRLAVEVATVGPVRIFTVEIKLEPIELADLLARIDQAEAAGD